MVTTARFTRLGAFIALALMLAACGPTAGSSPTAASPTPALTPAAPKGPPQAADQPTQAPQAQSAPKAAVDEQAIADFYQGKTVRIIVGFAPGGTFDTSSRVIARYLPKYVLGNPNVIVENKPGAGSALAANLVYNTEPKDGTVIASINEYLVLRQALDASGIEFDARKFNWLGSGNKAFSVCMVRRDAEVKTIEDTMQGGKEISIGTLGPGTNTHDGPAVLRAALGAQWKPVPGYEGIPKVRLAAQSGEVDGYCHGVDSLITTYRELVEGPRSTVRVIVSLGCEPLDEPFMEGVPTAVSLANTGEAKAMLRTVDAPAQMTRPLALAPAVSKDRVLALRRALEQTWRDQDFQAELKKGGLEGTFSTGEDVAEVVQSVLGKSPTVLAKLKDVLK